MVWYAMGSQTYIKILMINNALSTAYSLLNTKMNDDWGTEMYCVPLAVLLRNVEVSDHIQVTTIIRLIYCPKFQLIHDNRE